MQRNQKILVVIMVLCFLATLGISAVVVMSDNMGIFIYGILGGMIVAYALILLLIIKRLFTRKFYKVDGGMGAYGEVYVRDM